MTTVCSSVYCIHCKLELLLIFGLISTNIGFLVGLLLLLYSRVRPVSISIFTFSARYNNNNYYYYCIRLSEFVSLSLHYIQHCTLYCAYTQHWCKYADSAYTLILVGVCLYQYIYIEFPTILPYPHLPPYSHWMLLKDISL